MNSRAESALLRELNLELDIWYLDDGILFGTIDTIKLALSILKEHLPNTGLELNLLKCKLFGPGASCEDHAFDGIPRVFFAEGTIVLGVPIGSDDFTTKFIDDVCAKLAHLAKRIGLEVRDCQVSFAASMLWRLPHQPSAALSAF